MQNDLVSVIMPSYNSAEYIAESIESVIKQTYPHWELLITDDCSTDNTVEIVKQYAQKDNRIKLFVLKANSGAAIARNNSIKEAQGRYIALLDSDDLWLPEKLEKQIAFMKNNGYAFSYTQYSEIDESGYLTGKVISGPFHITKLKMYTCCWPGCLTVMYDANVIGLVQIADIKKNNDYAMWLKIINKVDCYLLKDKLSFYRKRSGSISNHNNITLTKWHYKLFREALEKNILQSILLTMIGMLCMVVKKLFFIKYINNIINNQETLSKSNKDMIKNQQIINGGGEN